MDKEDKKRKSRLEKWSRGLTQDNVPAAAKDRKDCSQEKKIKHNHSLDKCFSSGLVGDIGNNVP